MQGPNFETYAVAQGQVIVGGISGKTAKSNYVKNQTTSGRVPNGAIVEKEVAVTREDQLNVTLVLNEPDFTMSSKMVQALSLMGLNVLRQLMRQVFEFQFLRLPICLMLIL